MDPNISVLYNKASTVHTQSYSLICTINPPVHLWLHGTCPADGPLVDLGGCLHWQGDDGWWWWMWILWNLFWMLSFGFTTALSFAHDDVDGDSEYHNYNFPTLLRVWIFRFPSFTHYNVSVLLRVWHGQLKGGAGWRQEDVKMTNNKHFHRKKTSPL